ncbi:hypothetical protein ACFWIY_15050 [Streptomyces sioyaensis]
MSEELYRDTAGKLSTYAGAPDRGVGGTGASPGHLDGHALLGTP